MSHPISPRACRPLVRLSVLVAALACAAFVDLAGRQGSQPASAFAKGNLHAWAYEEYDPVSRTPAERALALKRIGMTKAGFVGRNVARMKEFDAYVSGYREHQIDLVAVWTPINTAAPLDEPHIRMFLDGVDRHGLKVQWWVSPEGLDRIPEADRVGTAVKIVQTLLGEATKRGLRLAIYGYGRDTWFAQPENEVAIIDTLSAAGSRGVGIAYNFHHAHSQLDRFATAFPKMLPHLIAINLNGMRAEGPMIIPIGEGDREQGMIEQIHRAGYRGAVGILAHTRTVDAAQVFERNMAGLKKVLTAIGDTMGASSY